MRGAWDERMGEVKMFVVNEGFLIGSQIELVEERRRGFEVVV